MALTKRWAGHVWGTNTGKVFVKLDGEDTALNGILRMNEPGVGIAVYNVQGAFQAPNLNLTGEPEAQIEGVEFGQLTVAGAMNSKGEIRGDWHSTNGAGGTFILYPHLGDESSKEGERVEQLYSARHRLGAIEVDHNQIVGIAENIRREFPMVFITVVAGTEQIRTLEDFKDLEFSIDKAEIIKIYASKPDGYGANQVISIEFGPHDNSAMVQGANEAWVLGQLETLKRDLKRYERTYITNFKRWGVGLNQIMILSALVFLPSLSGLKDRTILMGTILALLFAVNWIHRRYLPLAAIYLREKKKGSFGKVWPSVASWVSGIGAAVIAALLGIYLQGWLEIPVKSNDPPSATSEPSQLEGSTSEQ